MKTLPQKIKERRVELGLTQTELARKVGVSLRSVFSYEAGEKVPRPSTLLKLAEVLGVSSEYLRNDEAAEPDYGKKDFYISFAEKKYGRQGALDMEKLLNDNIALFAGGELSQSEKDIFFEAVMRAYITCKDKKSKDDKNYD